MIETPFFENPQEALDLLRRPKTSKRKVADANFFGRSDGCGPLPPKVVRAVEKAADEALLDQHIELASTCVNLDEVRVWQGL